MARDYIKIDTTTTTAIHAQFLKAAVREVRQAYDKVTFLKQMMDHMTDGSNFSDLEALFGLSAGQGQAVYNLVNSAMGVNARNFTEQVG